MSDHEATKSYEAKRAELAARHDEGAYSALSQCVEADVDCMAYCYGGSARIDYTETLAELAEQGWRLVRAAAERDALAARVEELEARIARALDKVCVIASPNRATYEQPGDCMVLALEARRILRGEDDQPTERTE